MSRTFLLSWDCLGLEAVINVSDIEQEIVWNTLRGDPLPNLHQMVSNLMIRARANPQRHYEIYLINTADDIVEQDLRDMFETDPQGSADLVRERGNKVFSDRRNATEVRIV